MLKRILASTALATLIAAGAYAQTATDTDTNTADPLTEGAQPGVPADDNATTPPEVLGEGATVPPATDPVTGEPVGGEVGDDPAATGMDATDPVTGIDDATGMGADPATTGMAPNDPAMEGNYQPVDISTISVENLVGTDIVNFSDETIASIEDVIVTDDGQVENIVAKFGGFLGFGTNSVVLSMDDVEIMAESPESEELIVRTPLTPEQIEAMPAHEG